jgi:hypothetical protein
MASQEGNTMDKVHVRSPEAVVFLKLASRALREHYKKDGKYPEIWPELDFTYVNGPHNLSDSEIRPTPPTREIWKPRGSSYCYRLETNPRRDKFVLEAINSSGKVEYTMSSDQETPVETR